MRPAGADKAPDKTSSCKIEMRNVRKAAAFMVDALETMRRTVSRSECQENV
jgi:hypothetical protein